jgi:hypothetical protein
MDIFFISFLALPRLQRDNGRPSESTSHFAYRRHSDNARQKRGVGLRSQDTGIYVGGEDVNLKDMNIQRNPFA